MPYLLMLLVSAAAAADIHMLPRHYTDFRFAMLPLLANRPSPRHERRHVVTGAS